MRITSIRVASVALILMVTYAVFGLIAFVVVAVGNTQYLTLPFGFVAPLFHLNFNFNLERSSNVFSNLFACIAAILFYSATGWLTGAVSALCFNFVAKRIGGIDAKYVSVIDK